MATAFRPAFMGTAVVVCVHDREKRKITELAYDTARTSLHLCSCCENLFTEPSDEPMFCMTCRGPFRHPLGGPLSDPRGRV